MAGHEWDLGTPDLFRHRARLLGVAGIVFDVERQFLAEQTASGIEVGDRHLSAVLHLPAEGRFAAGHGAGYRDGDVLRECAGRQCKRRAQGQADELE